MQPAICPLCGKRPFDDKPDAKGDWVEFIDYQELEAAHLSHPIGLEYFCYEHLGSAARFKDQPLNDALAELRLEFPNISMNAVAENTQQGSWFWRLFKF